MSATSRGLPREEARADGTRARSPVASVARRLLRRLNKGYRLQLILFAALVFISAVPVFLLATWVRSDALEKEVEAVTEKHLLLAQNLGGVLERYVTDVSETFRVAAQNIEDEKPIEGMNGLLRSLNFAYVVELDQTNNFKQFILKPSDTKDRFEVDGAVLADLRAFTETQTTDVVFSDLIPVNGKPMFLVVRSCDDGRLVVGALAPTFLREVQKSIEFGERGHSMIVDSKGIVVAHPNANWEATSKDASKLSVVQKMMRGETGVATFYSPPMQADMIAGHTTVAGVGWGVMVPQPFSELEDAASGVRDIAIALTLIGILAAAVIGWLLSKYMAAPIVAVARASSDVAAGGMHTRVGDLPALAPRELRVLSKSFNRMVTQLEQREAGLREAKEEAEAANRSKSDFLANISHELRTPLNAVIGFSELMRNQIHGPVGSPQYMDYLTDIHNSGRHLLDIINDVLDMSKIEAGTMDLFETAFDLRESLDACIRMVADRARQAEVKVTMEIPEGFSWLYADERMFRQIALNLLSNAVKFSDEGDEVTVSAYIDEDGGMVLQVVDRGIGIAADKIDRVMEPFVQVDGGMNRKYGGTGLGLALVRSMVELHDAEIALESLVGAGTTVAVSFPESRVCPPADGDEQRVASE